MKKFYLLFLSMLLPLVASADPVEIGGIYYNLDAEAKTAEVTESPQRNFRYSGEIIIPDVVKFEEVIYSVTSIGSGAFYGSVSLTSVTIPNSVTSIGSSSFENCSGLTSIKIPSSVTSIDSNPFSGCEGMASISVEDGNTKFDSRDNCNAVIETSKNKLIIGCKGTEIPFGITAIDMHAFAGCLSLTSVIIPGSVRQIVTMFAGENTKQPIGNSP